MITGRTDNQDDSKMIKNVQNYQFYNEKKVSEDSLTKNTHTNKVNHLNVLPDINQQNFLEQIQKSKSQKISESDPQDQAVPKPSTH